MWTSQKVLCGFILSMLMNHKMTKWIPYCHGPVDGFAFIFQHQERLNLLADYRCCCSISKPMSNALFITEIIHFVGWFPHCASISRCVHLLYDSIRSRPAGNGPRLDVGMFCGSGSVSSFGASQPVICLRFYTGESRLHNT